MAIVSFYKQFKDRYGLGTQLIDFINKLIADPANPSLHVERVVNAPDKRVRTARVTQKYRAVMYEFNVDGQKQFILVDVLNHDDAYVLATTKRMTSNPVNGVTQLIDAQAEIMSAAEIESRAKQIAAEKLAELQVVEDEKVVDKPAALSPSPSSVLTDAGISAVHLTDDLGLTPLTVEILWAAKSVDDVEVLLGAQPAWENDAVLGLLAGMTIDEVRAELGLKKPTGTEQLDPDSDEAIVAGMESDAAKMEFIVAPGQDELEAIISSGSLADWRVFLHPSQQRAVRAQHSGSARVTGGAGTGKTVVVIHRTKHLLDTNPGARVFLTTYTRDLANALKNQMNTLDPTFPEATVHGAPGLWISGIDALVYDVIQNAQKTELQAGLKKNFSITGTFKPGALDSKSEDRLWREAAELKAGDLNDEKKHPTFLAQEYSTVILTHGINDERSYLRVRRTGRGTALSRAERKAVWAIVEMFHAKCAAERRLTFAAMAVLAADIVEHRGSARMFDHVLIDEAQDFHAGHWRFLRACTVEGPNDIFLAEDSHQRIYGQRLTLSHYGISTRGRASTKLRVNYRTTAQNLGYATAILDGTEWIDSEEDVDDLHGYRSVRHGPVPIVLHASNTEEEADLLAKHITEWIDTDEPVSVGVLTRTNRRMFGLTAQLSNRDIPLSTVRGTDAERPVVVMTMHNAKGLEFTHVVLVDVSAEALPQKYLLQGLAEAEQEDAMQRERALLYVAASRARDVLVVSVVGEASELLPA